MKRLAAMLVLALGALGAPTAASAHAPDFRIAGFQFAYHVLFEEAGVAGYISVPNAPPVHVEGAASTNGGASANTDEGIGDLINTDRVPHTFTECTAACDTANGTFAGADFDIELAPGTTSGFSTIGNVPLESRLYTFMCKVHPYMRGEVSVG